MDIEAVTNHIVGGRSTKYEEEKHIRLLAKIMDNSEDIEAFCAEAAIAKTTFYDWLKAHPKFREAYDILINFAERKWKSYPLSEKGAENFNFPYWNMIMRNRFGFGKSKVKKAEDQNFLSKCLALQESLEEGTIGVQEYGVLMSGYVNELKGKALDRLLSKETHNDGTHISDMNEKELVDFIIASKT